MGTCDQRNYLPFWVGSWLQPERTGPRSPGSLPQGGWRPKLAEGPSLSLCESGNIRANGLFHLVTSLGAVFLVRSLLSPGGQVDGSRLGPKGPGGLLASLTAEVAWGQPWPGQSLAPPLIPAGGSPWLGLELRPKQQGCEAGQAREKPEPACSEQRGFETEGAALAKAETCVLRRRQGPALPAGLQPMGCGRGRGRSWPLLGLAVLSGRGSRYARTGQPHDGPGGARPMKRRA